MPSLTEYESAGKAAGLVIKFEYVGAKDNAGNPRSVEFYAYLKSYSDSFNPQWDNQCFADSYCTPFLAQG